MKRFLSLDVFRGMTILLMIVLNNQTGGTVFAPLVHSAWDRITLADMAFPFFLFIMGAAMWFSTHRHDDYGMNTSRSRAKHIGHIYLFASLLTLYFSSVRSVILTCIILLGGYWFLLDSMGTDIVGRVDVTLLGSAHLWTPTFDPEGLLSTIPSIASVLIGYLAGRAMDQPNSASGGISTLMVIGVLLGISGALFGMVSPMNKQLWTPSYVLFTSGAAMVVWSLLSFIIEYMQAQKWCEFFTIAGTNSLFIYSLSMILAKMFAIWGVTQAVFGFYQSYMLPDTVASLLWSLTMVIVCWLITWPLYRMRIFISA